MTCIDIQCGILQGDALSPLLFCLAMNPLSQLISATRYGYTVKSQQLVQHLFYMDDLKLYAKKENDLESIISTVHLFSVDIEMTINLNKSARLIATRGIVVQTSGVNINTLGLISNVDVSVGYKYLGILQDLSIPYSSIKEKLVKEYRPRLRSVLSS